jgi:hypothetical protein
LKYKKIKNLNLLKQYLTRERERKLIKASIGLEGLILICLNLKSSKFTDA